MQTHYATTKERLESVARTLARIELRRETDSDPQLGRAIESFLVNRELRELEHFAMKGE